MSQNEEILNLMKLVEPIIRAAVLVVYCPPHGGFKEDIAAEDTWEQLEEAVIDFVGVTQSDDLLSLEEMYMMLLAKGLKHPEYKSLVMPPNQTGQNLTLPLD